MDKSPDTDIASYYARRASEYEKVYAKPERQTELAQAKRLLAGWFAGQDVLEIACGTGYWTQVISATTRKILATDPSAETLAIARAKTYGCPVEFRLADAYVLKGVEGGHDAALAGFWYSHVPKPRRQEFLQAFHSRLRPGATVALFDNTYVPGSNNPMAPETDADGNTYSLRTLDDGSQWRVLKNFPTEAELRADLAIHAIEIEYVAMKYYWLTRYRLKCEVCARACPIGVAPPR